MTNDQLSEIRSRLKIRLSEFETKTQGLRADLLQAAETLPTVLCDSLDHAKEETDLNSRLSVHDCHLTLRKQIETALNKIESGTFGICDACDEDIELQRLKVQPFASLCLKCQTEIEHENFPIKNRRIAWNAPENFDDSYECVA